MGKTATSVLLKLRNGNEGCQTINAPLAHERNSFFQCKQHTNRDPRVPENI